MDAFSGEKRCRCVMLPVSSAFHTERMASAQRELSLFLDHIEFKSPVFPVISNVTGLEFPDNPVEMRKLLSEQVVSPVLWHTTVLRMLTSAPEQFLEIGPGKVLTGLMKRIDRNADCRNIANIADIENFMGAHT